MAKRDGWLTKAQAARKLVLLGSPAFERAWAALEETSRGGVPASKGDQSLELFFDEGKWYLPSHALPALDRAVSPRIEAKDEAWLDGDDLAASVPADCEAIAARLWRQVVSFSLDAREVLVKDQPLRVERRKTGDGDAPCLSAESLGLFKVAVRNARNRQVEASVQRAMDAESAPRM